MLEQYRTKIDGMSQGVRASLSSAFGLGAGGSESLFDRLHSQKFTQADLVLKLLHLRHTKEAESIVGRPLTRCPPDPRLHPKPLPSRLRTEDERTVVVGVAPNPRLPTTPSFQRYKAFRKGASVAQLIKRGVTRKDIREARREGWVQFQQTPT